MARCTTVYGRLRIHDVQQDVNYFIASGPKNCSAQNLFCFRINSDFDKALCFTFLNGPAHPAHRIFRSECSAPGLSYFGVRHAASAQRRIRIQSVGLDSVGHAAMVSVEEIVGDDLIVVVGSMRKGAAAVAVTQGPDAGHVGLQLVVNGDVAALVRRNPGPVETQVARVGSTSHGEKNMRADYFRRTFFACRGRRRYRHRVSPARYISHSAECRMPSSLQDFAHSLGNIFVFPSNQARSHFYNRDFAPEAAIDLSELQPNITSADDDEMLGQEIDVHHR